MCHWGLHTLDLRRHFHRLQNLHISKQVKQSSLTMEAEGTRDIVIVGAGISGLATAVGLHRLGIRSTVLESSEKLRATGFALSTYFNAWKALEALGISQHLRDLHDRLHGWMVGPISAETPPKEMLLPDFEEYEVRCVHRKMLLEALASELPEGTIRFLSKLVHIEFSGRYKMVHLSDGSVLKTKVLVGCDGVNSVVAKWLGFKNPVTTNRLAIRGLAHFPTGHGFEKRFFQFYGNGVRSGFVPCNHNSVYWFVTHTSTNLAEETSPENIKQFVLDMIRDLPKNIKNVVETTDLDNMVMSRLKYRPPWELLWANIAKDNVCVAGDALHPMTPDIGQGGCSAMEDGVILARCLGEAIKFKNLKGETEDEKESYKRIEVGLKKYAGQRKWRSIELIMASYIVGFIQQSRGKCMNLFTDMFLRSFLSRLRLKMSHFDCGSLSIDSK
ncbi:monooxygenase 2 [Capsella rubella]|uniref:monooxygenase 2 n=1 Tax=Capsella rubella TaxID=81985 RepID=UPI000CD4B880|nr:monooxygenase 2 [Capsella rubella]